ncbi:MAG: HIT domain-containing protein [Rhodospirillum sp.]|nr:HIT domain-containing protein [Rhodospirillum sp.]MCF8487570.1 HIT domain-containing protein [Rhodospirillum sp.]MCF8499053.1 HIT domain-containing protein [Rhodospirillum sp.]
MTGPCLFCEIALERIPSERVFESKRVLAFLDIHPIRRGHIQIIPKSHFSCFDDLPEGIASEILSLGQKIARVQKHLYRVERVAFLFSGGDIDHAHAHLVPMVEKTDITSRRYIAETAITFTPTKRMADADLHLVAGELRDGLGMDLGAPRI